MKRTLLCGVLLVAACERPTSLDETVIARSLDFASGVETARLMTDIGALVAGHKAETPFDCTRFNYSILDPDRYPVCNMTRENARAFVLARFQALGLSVTEHRVEDETYPTVNLIGELQGAERPEEVVLVGAHYDAYYGGADDNSSGVAAMLELARLAAGRRFARTIRFVAFDLSEFQFVGSSRYVQAHRNDKLVAVMNLDSIGFRDPTPGSQTSLPGIDVPDTGDFLTVIAREHGRAQVEELLLLAGRFQETVPPVVGGVAPELGLGRWGNMFMWSDHAPFWLAGFDALYFTDTGSMRNPNYYKSELIDTDFLTGAARLSAGGLSLWAEGPLP